MVKFNDIKPKVNNFYPDASYVPLGDLVGREIVIKAFTRFENREHEDSVAIHFGYPGDDGEYRTVTHSKAIIELLLSDEVDQAISEGGVECTITQRKSEKSGRNYLTLQ